MVKVLTENSPAEKLGIGIFSIFNANFVKIATRLSEASFWLKY